MKTTARRFIANIPYNAQVFFTDAEFDAARIIYLNQMRVARS